MSCDLSRGKNELACKNAVSGLKAIYMANYDNYGFATTSNSGSGHILTSTGSLDEVFKYELKNSGNTFQQDINSNRDTGTTFYNQVLNFVLTKLSKEMEFQVKMMAWGRPQIFVEMNAKASGSANRQMFLMGLEHGCEIGGNGAVGGTMDSLNGYTLTATAMESDPIYYLTDEVANQIRSIASNDNIVD